MNKDLKTRIAEAIERHRPAMDKVIQDARELAKYYREELDKIHDPLLRESARRS